MAVFYKLAIIATAALAAMVSAAPIDPSASASVSASAAAPAPTVATVRRQTTATEIPLEEQQMEISAEALAASPYNGRGTWFTDSVGSCGTAFNTNDLIVAMNAAQMGGTSQCGKAVKITSGGKTVQARVTDTCPAQFCSHGSLDLSQAVFQQLAPLSQGVIDIKWEFV
ncbi:hypothetical protein BGX28_003176 [Mortierella sp. GBA30]|nr:hypothetical protein BGX28_003176 [Mortierella sp. GBA30]